LPPETTTAECRTTTRTRTFVDRGDGFLVLVHPVDQVPKAVLLNRVVPELARLLADYNADLPRTAR